MEYLFVFAVISSLLIAFICALTEAALYAVPYAYVKHLADEGSANGKILLDFKEDMSHPITAILVLNTAGATLGASIAGAAAGKLFTEVELIVFGVLYTLATLYLAEITPKIAGVIYAREISGFMARPLRLCVVALAPLIWLSRRIHKRLESKDEEPTISHQEVLSMAQIGKEEGALDDFEGSVIHNVIGLDQVLVRDVMTPRVVVTRLPETKLVSEVEGEIAQWNYSRIPVHVEDEPDSLTGYVMQRDIFRELLRDHHSVQLKQIARKIPIVPELMRVDQLLLRMFEQREHICGVVDEHGAFVGIVTLEDLIEEIVGREIVDEYDTVSDMRGLASRLRIAKTKRLRETL